MHSDCCQINLLLDGVSSLSCAVKPCNGSFVISMKNVKINEQDKILRAISPFSVSSVFLFSDKCAK